MRNYQAIEVFITNKLKRDLSPKLYYHGVHHTFDVLRAAELIAADEKISNNELFLLKIAVLYHDTGYMVTYKEHEEESCNLARTDLPGFGLNQEEIEIICGMIMATKIPSNPQTRLERIIADADLEYLGTDNFERISNSLFEEAKIYRNVRSQHEWNEIQIGFLSQHNYYTNFCRKNREQEKEKHLNEIKIRI